MQHLDLTLPTPAENLALDEALLDEAERNNGPVETLRLWESRRTIVVVGRSSRIEDEVHQRFCREQGIPVLRRASGGAAIVAGPGCLMYGLVLSCRLNPALRAVDYAHRFVLGRLARALGAVVPGVVCRGISDLAVGDRKFSGNSIRVKRDHLLYHGTLLYDFRLERIEQCLAMPPRHPDYRDGRGHAAFVTNLPASAGAIREALLAEWEARRPRTDWPSEATALLARTKYSGQSTDDVQRP